MKNILKTSNCVLLAKYAVVFFKLHRLQWLTGLILVTCGSLDMRAQTFRAVSNEPSPLMFTARNNRIQLDNCNYIIGVGASARFCHSLSYASNEEKVAGHFDVFNIDGVFTSHSLIPISLMYLPLVQDTIWLPGPNPSNGIFSPSDTILNAMTCDFSGNVFAAGRGISVYRPSTNVLTYLGDLPPGLESAGGITHRNGEVFISTVNNSLARVDMQNPANTVEVMQFPIGTPIMDGLITFPYRCDSLVTFAIGRTDTGSIIYRLEFEPYSLTEICQIEVPIFAVAAREECIQPPCAFSLDLDRLDLSGAPDQDFRADTTCVTPMPVAAAITEVRAAIPIDSIRVELSGILDVGQEYLVLAAANNLTVLGSGSPVITLVSNGSSTAFSDFEAALSAIRYHNDAPAVTYGQREVHSQAFAVFYRSLPATTYLPLSNEKMRLEADITQPSCFGASDGAVLANATGGIAPYTFQWANGPNGALFDNLSEGTYSLIISDALGCRNTDTVYVSQPEMLVANIAANTTFACGAEAILTASGTGGTMPYSFVWSDGNSEMERDSMAAGTYSLTLTDANGCLANTVFQLLGVPIIETPITSLNFCKGENFLFEGTTYTSDTTFCQTYTSAVTGCDSLYCLQLTFFDTVRVEELRQICSGQTALVYGILIGADTTICRVFETYLGCDSTHCVQVEVIRREGQMAATICEGETYLFGGQSLSESGFYQDTIIMPSGCDSLVQLTLHVMPAPVVQLSIEGSFCNGGLIRIAAGIYHDYQWSTGATTAFIDIQSPGTYGLTVTDADGCTGDAMVDIPADARIEFAYMQVSPTCFGDQNGFLQVDTAFGGQAPYQYALNEGAFQMAPVFNNLSSGAYELVIEDANGCRAEAMVSIETPEPLVIDAGEDRAIRLGDTIQLQAIANPLSGLHFQWNPPSGLACDTCVHTFAFPGESTLYEVILTNEQGCTVQDEVFIQVDRRGGLYVPNAFSPNDDGINDRFFVNTDSSVKRITRLRIFDRWGALVFEQKDSSPNAPDAGWDGKIRGKRATQGVYAYTLEVERADGQLEQHAGEITLIR